MRRRRYPAPLVEPEASWNNACCLVLGAGWVLFVVGLDDVALAFAGLSFAIGVSAIRYRRRNPI